MLSYSSTLLKRCISPSLQSLRARVCTSVVSSPPSGRTSYSAWRCSPTLHLHTPSLRVINRAVLHETYQCGMFQMENLMDAQIPSAPSIFVESVASKAPGGAPVARLRVRSGIGSEPAATGHAIAPTLSVPPLSGSVTVPASQMLPLPPETGSGMPFHFRANAHVPAVTSFPIVAVPEMTVVAPCEQ